MLFSQSLSRVWLYVTHGLQHSRLPCLSPSPRVCSSSCSLIWWCHPTILSSVIPFSCLQSSPVSGSFPMSWLLSSGGQHIGASASDLPMSDWSDLPVSDYSRLIFFRIDWFDLLAVQGTLNSLLQHHKLKASVLWCSVFFMVQLSHLYMMNGKPIALTIWTFVGKMISLLCNMQSMFVIAFIPRSKFLLILWLQSSSQDFWSPRK